MNKESIEKYILSRDHEGLRRERQDALAKVGQAYRRGVLTDDELRRTLYEFTAYRDICAALTEGLGVTLRRGSYTHWIHMLMDYGDWKTGRQVRTDAPPWLFSGEDSAAGPIPAKPEKRFAFFSALEALGCPLEYFAVPPPGFPRREMGWRNYNDYTVITVFAKLIDDGGLLRDEAPEGKRFRLYDINGCRADVTITGTQDESSGKVFLAVGRIDGYTGEKQRRIDIIPLRNRGPLPEVSYSFTLPIFDRSDRAAGLDTRWLCARHWEERHVKRLREYEEALFRSVTGRGAGEG